MSRHFWATLLAFALLVGAGVAAADDKGRDAEKRGSDGVDHKRVEFGAHSGKFLLHNDKIAVWFAEGKQKAKPDLRIAFNGTDDEKAGYRVQILRLVEVPQDMAGHLRGGLPRVNLAKADDWNVQTVETNESITVTMIRAEAQAILTLTFHIDTTNATVKYDLKVDNWRWANASDRLVLDMLVLGHNLRNETGAKVSVADAGYITWADSAEVKDAAGTRTIPVESFKKTLREARDDDEGEHDDEGENGGHIMLMFNGTGGYSSLNYDPTFGVTSASSAMSPVPSMAPLVAVGVIAAMALGLRRRT